MKIIESIPGDVVFSGDKSETRKFQKRKSDVGLTTSYKEQLTKLADNEQLFNDQVFYHV
jgi:hypothetical protein